ncbi:MAG: DNA polymerase III subunit alpha, partial [Prevotellaceae bacterium]|nr:DNA polymerase III subunit alpha [Prevotellaceae bacterium]
MKNFVHLHVHSHYSVLDGMASISGLVDKAIKSGMNAIALTDHGNMFGVKDLFDYVKKKNKSLKEEGKEPFKAILGCEVYVARNGITSKSTREDRGGYHLILLAKNKKGYQNLCKLVSLSWINGFYNKPRIDHALLEQYSEGLIACSACLGGEIPQKLMGKNAKDVDDDTTAEQMQGMENDTVISESNLKEAETAVLWYKRVFGDDFYLEMQRHRTDKAGADQEVFRKQQEVNKGLVELARKTNTKLVATNDVHFVEEEHAEAHDRLICLSTSKDLDDPRRMRYTKQEWLKTPEEMAAIFGDLPEVFDTSLEIAEKVEIYDINSEALMPKYDIPADFGTVEGYKHKFSEEDLKKEFGERFEALAKGGLEKIYRIKLEADYLEKLTMEGAKLRYGNDISEEVMERIRFELDTMKTMGYPGYFLIVQDFINAGREMGISFGPGRGSAAGSVVAYCLKITDLDPLEYDLLFERFLNPDRISMPDIDVDIEADGRGKVLQWVTEKYGAEKVARIITYGTMATKSSIKDVARVQKLPLQEAERLVKLIPDSLPEENGKAPKINVKNCVERVPELRAARNSHDENLSNTLK